MAAKNGAVRGKRGRLHILQDVLVALPLLILLSCQSAPAPLPSADWADVTLHATGLGTFGGGSFEERIRAIQQAKQDAARQLTAQILALPTDSGKTVAEQAQKGNNMKKVAAFARRAEILAIEPKAGQVHLRARLFLGDSFKAALGLLPYKERNPQPLNSHGAP